VPSASQTHLRLCPPFVHEAGVVKLFVAFSQSFEEFVCFGNPIRCVSTELIRDGQAEDTDGDLVLGLDGQDVVTDGFCLFGFVQ
jgi:hypothetical protein